MRGIGGGRIDSFFNKENEKVSLNRLLSDIFLPSINIDQPKLSKYISIIL